MAFDVTIGILSLESDEWAQENRKWVSIFFRLAEIVPLHKNKHKLMKAEGNTK